MDDQPLKFHATYADLVAGLPPSQLKEARKRLMACKQQPLTAEEVVGEHPKVLACLEKIAAAYKRKKTRSSVASKCRRDAVREKLAGCCSERTETADVTAAKAATACCLSVATQQGNSGTATEEGGTESLVSSLSACTVECTPEDAAEPEIVISEAGFDRQLANTCINTSIAPPTHSDVPEPPPTKSSRPKRCLVRPAVPAAAAAAAAAVPAAAAASCVATAQPLAKKASGSSLVSRR